MGTISTEGTPVALASGSVGSTPSFPISISGHLLLVYKNDAGAEFVIRGGPTPDGETYGNLIVEINVPIAASADRRTSQIDGSTVAAEDRGNTTVNFGDRDPDKGWEILKQHAANIHSAGFAYSPLGFNSNGTIGNLLSVVGISIENYEPNPDGMMLVSFSGKDLEFSFDYSLCGTEDNDILVGRGGKQTFFGDAAR